jgi:hypothetical protein
MRLAKLLRLLFPEAYIWTFDPTSYLPARNGTQDAVGLIIQPGPHSAVEYLRLFLTNPEEVANLWGHTAMYVRRNGRIVRAIGFDPHRLDMVADLIPSFFGGSGGGVSGGTRTTPGVYYDERPMFRSPDMIVVEFPLEGRQQGYVNNLLQLMPHPSTATPGLHRGYLQQYLTNDGENFPVHLYDPSIMGNCINSLIQVLTGMNLVVSLRPDVPEIRSGRTQRLMAHRDYDITAFQGQLTNVVLRGSGRRQPNLVLHDLNTGDVITPVFQGRGMSRPERMGRRIAGMIETQGAARLLAHSTVSTLAAWQIVDIARLIRRTGLFLDVAKFLEQPFLVEDCMWEYACLTKLVLNVLMEGLPSDSEFWRQPVHMLDWILCGIVKFCFVYRLLAGDISAWFTAAWMILSLILAWFGG